MSWFWRAEPSPADPSGDLGGAFASQQAAEAWLTAQFAELSADGVRTVALYEEGRLVYGPMSLDAE